MATDKRRRSSETTRIPGTRYYCSRCYKEYDHWMILCPNDNGTLFPWFKRDWLSRAVVLFSAITILPFILAIALPKGTYWTKLSKMIITPESGQLSLFVHSTLGILFSLICIVLMLQEKQKIPALLWPTLLAGYSGIFLIPGGHWSLSILSKARPGVSLYSFLGSGIIIYFAALILAIIVGILALVELLWSGRKFGWKKWNFDMGYYAFRMIICIKIVIGRISRRPNREGTEQREI